VILQYHIIVVYPMAVSQIWIVIPASQVSCLEE